MNIPASGVLARCAEIASAKGNIDGIPVIAKTFGDIVGLPSSQEDVAYIVSALVAQAAWKMGRQDVYCPGNPVRNDESQIIGCQGLCCNPN